MGSILLNLVGVITAIIAVMYAYFKWRYQYFKTRNVPYLEPTFPFGNMDNPFKRSRSIGDRLSEFYKTAKKNGWRYCGIFRVAEPYYIIVDLEMAKNVMTKDFHHFTDRKSYTNEKDDPLSAHLFAIGGKKWRNLRTKLTPTFTSGKLKAMFQTLVDCGLVLQQFFEENVDSNEPFDIKDILGRFSTDIIGSCAFGLDCNSFKEPNSPFRVHSKRAFNFSSLEVVKLIFCTNFPNLARALGLRMFSKPVIDFFCKVSKDTVNYREKNNIVRKDFMQLLIDLKNREKPADWEEGDGTTLTMDEIAAQSFVFFFAGFETSSTTMTFALFELAVNPDIQDRVRDEIKTVLEKYDNKMTYDSLTDLKYMKQVIDEVLRKYPPLSFVGRVCVEDYKVPGQDLIIEKDTGIVIPIKGIHYDEEYYEEPEKFDPDRFTEEKKRERNRYAHLPFGEGPRICIGERFGIMQTKVGLTSILQKFRVKLNKKTKVPLKMSVNAIISTTESPIWLDLEKI